MNFFHSIFFTVVVAILAMTVHVAHGKGAVRGIRRLEESNDSSNSTDSVSLSFDEDEEALLESSVCEVLADTTAYGLCVAYCDAKDCANDNEEPSGSGRKMAGKKKSTKKNKKNKKGGGKNKVGKSQSCGEIKDNFFNLTGWASFPCEELEVVRPGN